MKKKLITSALPYVNNAPHLGNIIGCVLSADVYARFCRLRGYETLYVCGTDGYGTATENKARLEGTTPKEICEKYQVIHEKVYDFFNISFDAFGKTFTETHTEVVQGIYQDLDNAGALIEQSSEQSYCATCSTFLADRLIEGNCPHCGSDQARGDQCDNCGKLLNPIELLKPRCVVCATTPERKLTSHLYLNLPELQDQLAKWQDNSIKKGEWTFNAVNVTNAWMKQGLNPRPITRDLKWGVPVPRKGYENKVFYVWFDAPIGYISITKKFFPDTWKDWWLDPKNVELYQFLGKDNIPFHSIIFPACQLGSKKEWTMLHHLNATEFLNYENQKFSKSKNIGIFGTDIMELGFEPDFWRFYLLSTRPEKQDSNFLWSDFFDRINNELNDNIGNLINRVIMFYMKNYTGPFERYEYKHDSYAPFLAEISKLMKEITDDFEKAELRSALKNILLVGNASNKFFHEQELWTRIKTDQEYTRETLTLLINVIHSIAVTLQPFIPTASARILKMLNASENVKWSSIDDFNALAGRTHNAHEQIFSKMDVSQIKKLKARFAGELSLFDKLDIRVAEVCKVEAHPAAAHLYVLDMDLGEKKVTVAAALKDYYSEAELQGKKLLMVKNLNPADLRGVISEGMILTAQQGKKLEVLSDESWKKGARVYRDGVALKVVPNVPFEDFVAAKLQIVDHKLNFDEEDLLLDGAPVKTKLIAKGKVK